MSMQIPTLDLLYVDNSVEVGSRDPTTIALARARSDIRDAEDSAFMRACSAAVSKSTTQPTPKPHTAITRRLLF